MTDEIDSFDRWIRTSFVAINTSLEERYFCQADRLNVAGIGSDLKLQVSREGEEHVARIAKRGSLPATFDDAFAVLGNIGLLLGALRRHELTNPDRETRSPFEAASSLALQVGASIGMVPRFTSAHLATHNLAVNGVRKSFTSLPDELLFIDENARGMFSFKRAADALARIVPLGASNPVAKLLLNTAAEALRDAMRFNDNLNSQLDVDRFFFCVRPYYKPYRVGRQEFRGANAGDFSGINEIDLLLGLRSVSDPSYAQHLADKMPFIIPEEQARLRECVKHGSLLDELLSLMEAHSDQPWFRDNAVAFLDVCDLFGETARQHHDQLVERFIVGPAVGVEKAHLQNLTASGPPLAALLRALENFRDFRVAARRDDLPTRHDDLARLRRATVS